MKIKEVGIFIGGAVFGGFAVMKLIQVGCTEMSREGKFDMQRYCEKDGKWYITTQHGLEISDERKEFK